MSAYSKFVAFLKANDVQPVAAPEKTLAKARERGFPEELIRFYETCAPDDCFEGVIRLNGVEAAIMENEEAIPGMSLFPKGYFNCGSTYCGDGYFIDTNVTDRPKPVCIFSHDMLGEESSQAEVDACRKEVAKDFEDFLDKFMDESLDEEPSYESPGNG